MAALSMRTKLSKKFHFHNPFTHSVLRNTYLIMAGRGALNIYLFIFQNIQKMYDSYKASIRNVLTAFQPDPSR